MRFDIILASALLLAFIPISLLSYGRYQAEFGPQPFLFPPLALGENRFHLFVGGSCLATIHGTLSADDEQDGHYLDLTSSLPIQDHAPVTVRLRAWFNPLGQFYIGQLALSSGERSLSIMGTEVHPIKLELQSTVPELPTLPLHQLPGPFTLAEDKGEFILAYQPLGGAPALSLPIRITSEDGSSCTKPTPLPLTSLLKLTEGQP